MKTTQNTLLDLNSKVVSNKQTVKQLQADNKVIFNNVMELVALKKAELSGYKFSNNKALLQSVFNLLDIDSKVNKLDTQIKQAIIIQSRIMIDGYKFKKELLSISKMIEMISRLSKEEINELFNVDIETYNESISQKLNSKKVKTEALKYAPKKSK